MKRSRNKIIVLVMLLAMIAGTLGAAVPMVQSTAQNQAPVERVREVVALRETNSETYLLSDGSYECVIYAGDKYYRDSRNALKLIDNTLILDEATAKTDRRHYKNTANSFQVTFSDSDTPSVTMAKDDFAITFRAESASGGNPFQISADSKAVIIGAVRNCDTLTQLTDTGTDTITYANAFYNTDLVYVLQNNALKEYIVLKNANAPNAITFRFSMEGLTLEESDGIGVFLDEDNNEVFRLDRLFAVDGNEDMTEALTYTFTSVKGSRDILVTVTLDAEYLAAEDRAFPVVIDPSVMISSAQTADASVYSAYPDTNYQMEKRLRTGKDTTYGKRRAYLRFPLPIEIIEADIISATLDIKKHSGVAPKIRAYQCNRYWHSDTITWNNMPDYTVVHISSEAVPRSSGSAWYQMDVTDIVSYWQDYPEDCFGFVVRDNVESNTDRWTTFYSSDAPSPNKPELHITYTEGDDTPITPGEESNPGNLDITTPDDNEDDVVFPEMYVCIQFDKMYAINMGEIYNEEGDEEYPDTISHLQTVKNRVAEYFFEQYSLIIHDTQDSYLVFESYADQHMGEPVAENFMCMNSTYSEGDGLTLQADHPTNLYNIHYRINNSSPNSIAILSYIGHDICWVSKDKWNQDVHKYNSEEDEPFAGVTLYENSTIAIAEPRGTDWEIVTTIHEIGHLFGIKDHYDFNITLEPGQSDECIYGLDKINYNTVSRIKLCTDCTRILNSQKSRYGTR